MKTGATTAVPLRNVAIIAHVDHGKTTLVDGLLSTAGTFREGQVVAERVMDRMDLEKERGITIMAKNCALSWKGIQVNIVDTPGHADFGGEVERTLNMVEGALLLVDAAEGPMPQTRFVTRKALANKLRICVLINKIDRKDARARDVLSEVFDTLADLGASDEQLDFPYLFTSGIEKLAKKQLEDPDGDLSLVLDMVLEQVPPPDVAAADAPLQLLVSNLDRSDYFGRLGIGRVRRGTIRRHQEVVVIAAGGARPGKVLQLQRFRGVERETIESAGPGEIVTVAGLDDVAIGDTIADAETPEALPRISVDEPVLSLEFSPNSSPLAGRSGKYVTSRHLRERLFREQLGNPAIRVEETAHKEILKVSGRGELQLGVLLEIMRREGYEMTVSRPEVILKEEGGRKLEPYERVTIDCPEEFIGALSDLLSRRRGKMLRLDNPGYGRVRMEFRIPSQGLIGLRTKFRVLTKGEGVLNTEFDSWQPLGEPVTGRKTGALMSDREGKTTPYALWMLEDRGTFFVPPKAAVYCGMVVGEAGKDKDLWLNVCREKHLTNVRAAGADEAIQLTPHRQLTLEDGLEWIEADELLEVTPDSFRIRKRVLRKP
ncbi:MAG: translational GTPase TypA [Planctomycetales bacterium]|nr:translational GTPase TypA [Planctomycetales bacterium]